jgi:hypothetical protein
VEQVTLLQHWLSWVQDWPYRAQPGAGDPASKVTTGGGAPQTPLVEPWATRHWRPAQQSASTVHGPTAGLQSAWQES